MKIKLIHISIKMTLAGVIALFLAYFMGITYYTTAAAISILSIQWTKRDFINIAFKRLISGVLAIILSAILFYYIGNTFWAFALFLVVFTNLSWIFNAPEGIVPSVVVVTHFLLVSSITVSFVLEEILLLLIAIIVAFVINMLYPQFSFNRMQKDLLLVDGIIESELSKVALNLKDNTCLPNQMEPAKKALKVIMDKARMVDRDIIMQNDHRYITYLYMRNTQLDEVIKINNHLCKITSNHPYKDEIADFLLKLSQNISFGDKASKLLEELNNLKQFFINSELPKSRDEFETRAMLFQIVNEIDAFLQLKINFHNQYPTFNKGENTDE